MSAPRNNPIVLALERVSKTYSSDGQRVPAVADVSLEIKRGEFVLLLGPSGSGKTTILTLLAGFLQPTSGTVRLLGKSTAEMHPDDLQRERARSMGFVFQNFLLLDALTVLENVVIVQEFCGTARTEARANARRLLNRLGVGHLASRFPPSLSHGEQQRVAIARALANNAGIVLADEPTASLESSQAGEIAEILGRLVIEEGRCMVVASHDLRLCHHAQRIIHLRDGHVVRIEKKA